MGHYRVVFRQGNQQGLLLQPAQQFGPVRGVEDLAEGVFAFAAGGAVGHRQQMQVVVAQHGMDVVTQGVDPAQGAQRVRPAIDQIPGQKQTVAVSVEANFLQQTVKRPQTALQIPNRIISHKAPPAPACMQHATRGTLRGAVCVLRGT